MPCTFKESLVMAKSLLHYNEGDITTKFTYMGGRLIVKGIITHSVHVPN